MVKAKSKPGPKIPFTKEQCQQALDASLGNISKAAKLLKYKPTKEFPKGREVPRQTLEHWIFVYNLKYYADHVKARIVKMAVDKIQDKGINYGDNQCLFKIVDKWGKYIGFGEEGENVTQDSEEYEGKKPYKAPRDLMKKRDESLGYNK